MNSIQLKARVETLPTTPQSAMKHAYARDADIIEIGLLKSEKAVEEVAEHALTTKPQIPPSSHPNEQRQG